MNWTDWLTLILVQLGMLAGIAVLVIPVLPGLVIMWLAALAFGFAAGGWSTTGLILFGLITIVMVIGSLVDNVLMAMGASKGGAAWQTVVAATIAGILGTIIFPPFGGIIAALLIAAAIEFVRYRRADHALRAGAGVAVGWGLSFVVRLALGILLMILWWAWALSVYYF
jgi:uncharacterized protein YqgC (DUF456 family)